MERKSLEEIAEQLSWCPCTNIDCRDFCVNVREIIQALETYANERLEEAAKLAEVSADYYSKNMKRKDGTFNTTVGSAAQTSWDIAQAIRALKSPTPKEPV